MTKITPPPGYDFDPFADARMGVSLFQMAPEDWLVPAQVGRNPEGRDRNGLGAQHEHAVLSEAKDAPNFTSNPGPEQGE